jgi:AcrR family transcriptional regulator
MARKPKRRAYDASSRQEGARATRQAILAAARRIFVDRGYAAATMPDIAKAAGVALDTVYAAVGKKPALFRLLVETAISGEDEAVAAEQRDYVRAIRAEPEAQQKLRIYAAALCRIQPRLAPLFSALQSAAPLDADLRSLWQEIADRRARNMRLLVDDLAATGCLRPDLSRAAAADIIWSMNSPEYYLLLVEQRRWSLDAFEAWLGDAWIRLLLVPPPRSRVIGQSGRGADGSAEQQ